MAFKRPGVRIPLSPLSKGCGNTLYKGVSPFLYGNDYPLVLVSVFGGIYEILHILWRFTKG